MIKNKKVYLYILSTSIFVGVSTFLFWNKTGTRNELHEQLRIDEPLTQLQQEAIIENPSIIAKGKNNFIGFKEKMGFRESRGNYFITNDYGYMGKYQFGKTTLEFFGVTSSKEFLNNPALQEKVFKISLSHNKWRLKKEIERFEGKHIAGVRITESGILAAAHLVGVGSVKSFLKSGGYNTFADANGTSITNYMKSFQGYDLSDIKANPFDLSQKNI